MHNGCRISQPMVFPMDHPTNPDQPKGIKQVLTERAYGDRGCIWIAKSPRSAQLTQLIAVHAGFFHSSLIFWNRNPVSRKSLKLLGTCASSCQSFTVNSFYWVLLGCSQEIPAGALWLYIWNTQDEPSESSWISSTQHHKEVGTPDDPVDGAYRDWEKCKGCTVYVKKYGSHKYTSHRKAQRLWHEGLMNRLWLIGMYILIW